MPARKPSAAATRLCHAVGLVARLEIVRWVAIDDALDALSAADRVEHETVIAAAVRAGLVKVNSGPIAHSIQLTADGLAACRAAAERE